MCGNECCLESECWWLCMPVVGKSVVVGLDAGESECKDAALGSAEGGKGEWADIAIVVG